ALACGNAVILRPSETTPLTSLALAELAGDARLPAGVLNLVPGGDEVRDALLAHPGIAAVAQVGPTPASGIAAAALAGTGRRVRLDLPSTAVHLVFDDAPVDDAVEGIVQSAFAGAAFEPRRGSLLLVQESVAQDLLARIKRRMATLRVGDPLDQNTDVGPLPCASRLASARAGVAAVPEGETWSLECDLPERGFWFPPTLVTTAVPAAVGPVLAIRSFRTPAEALALANGTGHGVSAGVWTEKGSRALALADRLRADVVWVNTFNRYTPSTAFGWHGGADFGREGGTGGLEAYLAS
ncbi:MAG: aldehyde dehydrogenase family protein, partial [Dactylosporangium sp.]|nr:aldehyde dehydrogenase family protein [Dactylosporangium sp.]NNJ63104.1 aldehyde dehydrogenase family protein [Dactylosporangium sp.]